MNRSASPTQGNAYANPPMQQHPSGPQPQGPYPQPSYSGPPPPQTGAPQFAPAGGVFAPAVAHGRERMQQAMAPAYQAAHRAQDAIAPAFNRAKMLAKEPVRSTRVPKWAFISVGLLLLLALCIVPVWNAFALMTDGNFVFWVGRALPVSMVSMCFCILLAYLVVCLFYFSYSANPGDERTVLMMANLFVMLLGMALMITSLPITRTSIDTYNNLMYRCDYSDQTHRMWEYSQVLHNIRMQPECAQRFTVEECEGYADAAPYTSFLKAMENDFRCSGFCYRPPTPITVAVAMPVPMPAPAPAPLADAEEPAAEEPDAEAEAASLIVHHRPTLKSRGGHKHHHHHNHRQLSFLETSSSDSSTEDLSEQLDEMVEPMPIHALYPPTLFSDANYQASCEGMAARDIRNFGGDIGYQTFYQGVYLVLIAITMGILKLIGFCIPNGGEALEKATENLVNNARNMY